MDIEPADAHDPLLQFCNVIITHHLGGTLRSNSLDDIRGIVENLAHAVAVA